MPCYCIVKVYAKTLIGKHGVPGRLDAALVTALGKVLGEEPVIEAVSPLSGGSINESLKVTLDSGAVYFMKCARGDQLYPSMFELEAEALRMIATSKTVRVPETHYAGEDCLIQTLFEQTTPAPDWHERLGRQLASMHKAVKNSTFGYRCDNYLGTSRQRNEWCESWRDFWRERRLEPQIRQLASVLPVDDALLVALNQLSRRLDHFLADWSEPAAFIHGDLWSGNAAADESGSPIIFDPAAYFASREAEFGMMRLFGGFGSRTEAAYQEVWPFEPEAESRIEIYRLYHLINHLILFGPAYYTETQMLVKSLL